MIILPSTSAVLRARLTAAPATTNPTFAFAYGDEPVGSGQATGSNEGALNGTTNVSLVGSPAASTSRVIPSGFIYNADTASVTVIVEYFDGTNARQIGKYSIASGATLTFSDSGFGSAGGSIVVDWGEIGGTLSDQTDLQAALDAKAGLASANVFTAQQAVTPYRANISGTVSIDLAATAKSNNLHLTLTGNVTSFALTNPVDGAVYNIRFIQDSTGSRTITLPSAFKFAGGTAPTFSTAANAVDFMSAEYGSTEATYMAAFQKGMA